MNLLALYNIIGAAILAATLIFMLIDPCRKITKNSKVVLLLLFAMLALTKISNILEYLGISNVLEEYEGYFEIMIPVLWAALIYSMHSSIMNSRLVKSLTFQEIALDAASQGLWSWNIQTNVCTFDERWCSILGYTLDVVEPVIDTWLKLTHPDDKDRVEQEMNSHLRGEAHFLEVEQRLKSRSGKWKWVLAKGRIIERDDYGAPLLMAGTMIDIDAVKRLNQQVASSETLYTTVFENTGTATLVTEEDTSISSGNQRAAELLGIPADELDGRHNWTEFVPEDCIEMMLDYHRRRRIGDDSVPQHYESRFIRPDGNTLDVLVSVAMIPDSSKSVVSLLDITDLKKSEQKRLEMEREVRYAQRLESLGVMAAGIAHDFNNLLMVIMGNADLIRKSSPKATSTYKYADHIVQASGKAADICKQMLAYSGDQNLVVEDIDLNLEIKKISRMLEMSVAKNAVLQYRLAEGIPSVAVDIMQIRQVILNLVINASEAVEAQSGYVTLSTGAMDCGVEDLKSLYIDDKLHPGRYVYIKVQDTGVGMDDNTLRHIFDPFFTTKFPGRGLGMSTVLGVVRGHLGTVKIESEKDKGSSVMILLPTSARKSAPADAAAAPASDKSPEPGKRPEGKVLLVDDEDGILEVASAMLRSLGMDVLTAEDGREAIVVHGAHRDEIACIVMDLSMPHIGGDEATRRIREIDPDVPIIISSGYSADRIEDIFKDIPINGFVNKPYERKALGAAISDALST